jgi:phenylpropionate dioxygenase-like ring-hydroxylating dioxygenase large terminal subunit
MTSVMPGDSALPPFPIGWYAVAWSSELGVGDVATRLLAGREIVAFRTDERVGVLDAHCAHLGAHLGMGGTVEGGSIRCPFHGFCFDADGTCVATGYGTPVPKGLSANSWAVEETDGAVFVWYHPNDREPQWRLPTFDPDGFGPISHRTYHLRDHPQETTENSVDLGHFAVVHGYSGVELVRDLKTDGTYLNIAYRATRPLRPLGPRGPAFDTTFSYDIHVHGLGYSQVDVDIPSQGLSARLLVLATPTDGEHVELRLGLRLADPVDRTGLSKVLPSVVVQRVASYFILNGFAGDARQDFPIWENKRYVSPPRLARGDGPIGAYRKWAAQFYV